jgi:DNA polymerase II small subunit/DNA polymerase delta subunit B
MKAVTVKEISHELLNLTPKELRNLCLRLSRFKKENKELLTYLLFEASDEASYVDGVKKEIDMQFEMINKKSYYFIKKCLRRILFNTRKYIRYSQNKKTEIDLLIYYCLKMKEFTPSIQRNAALRNLYIRLIATIRDKLSSLHEDLKYDYEPELKKL